MRWCHKWDVLPCHGNLFRIIPPSEPTTTTRFHFPNGRQSVIIRPRFGRLQFYSPLFIEDNAYSGITLMVLPLWTKDEKI